MIESRYTIEYITPDSTEESGTKKTLTLFTFLALIVITILIYALSSTSQLNDFVRVSNESQGQKNGIIDGSSIDNKITSTPPIQQDIDKPYLKGSQQTPKQTKQLNN